MELKELIDQYIATLDKTIRISVIGYQTEIAAQILNGLLAFTEKQKEIRNDNI